MDKPQNFDNIPNELKERNQWVVWKVVIDDKGKATKPPFSIHTSNVTDKTNPDSWCSFDEAVKACNTDNYDGIGFCLTSQDPYTGFDFDKIIDDDGNIEEWVTNTLEKLDSYTEYSPSNKGFHTIVRGNLPTGWRHTPKLQLSDDGMYLTFTGNVYKSYSQINDRFKETIKVWESNKPSWLPESTDQDKDNEDLPRHFTNEDALISKIQTSKIASEFNNLFVDGDLSNHQDDSSRADLALCRMLAFWSGKDANLMDKAFRKSALYRNKWDSKRGVNTYGSLTINNAILLTKKVYDPTGGMTLATDALTAPEINKDNKHLKATYLEAFSYLGYSFSLNTLDDSLFLNNTRLEDTKLASIRVSLRELGFSGDNIMHDMITSIARDNRFNPIKDYLESLEWDGKKHIDKLASYFTDEHNSFKFLLPRFLIGAVAKVYKETDNPMLVLDGAQDIGKSYFCKWLVSKTSRPSELFEDSELNPDDKDHIIKLSNIWIWEVGELTSTTTKADRNKLKMFLTKSSVNERRAYARLNTRKKTVASFIGTLNNDIGFLNDPTGHKRFNPTTITNINWDYVNDVDVDQVWAEAVARFKGHETHRLTPSEKKLVTDYSDKYTISTPVESLINQHYKITNDAKDFITTQDIANHLKDLGIKYGNDKALFMDISQAMVKKKIEKSKRRTVTSANPVNGYEGIVCLGGTQY